MLPAFVEPAAERAFMTAYAAAKSIGPDRPVEWRHGDQFGFVTLSSIEPNGCRNFRFTRNTVKPIDMETRQVCN